MLKNSDSSYGTVSKIFHWVISPLVIVMLIVGYFMMDISSQSWKMTTVNLHKLTGIVILGLMVARLIWALNNPKPKLPSGTSFIEHLAEWSVHFLLYALIIVQPIVGWVGSVAGGYVPHVGSFLLNLPIQKSKDLSDLCFKIHNTLAVVIIVVVSLHVLAALYHHFIRRDNVLKRMLF